jgi:hypothetical protein
MSTGIKIVGIAVIAAAFLFTWWKSRKARGGDVPEDPGSDAPLDDASLEDLRINAKTLVWGGFMRRGAIIRALPDIAAVEASASVIAPLVDAEIALKREVEKTWPERTDCDRLDAAFGSLNERGIFARQYMGYTQSDALADMAEALSEEEHPERFSGYCFYTAQDVESLVIEAGRSLFLGFATQSDDTSRALQAGRLIREVLGEHGFETGWDETPSSRIEIRNVDWKRRGP